MDNGQQKQRTVIRVQRQQTKDNRQYIGETNSRELTRDNGRQTKIKEFTNYRLKVTSKACLPASFLKRHLISKCTSLGP